MILNIWLKNKMLKKIIVTAILMLSYTLVSEAKVYDMSVPLEGKSIANDTLQSKVLFDVYKITAELNPVCFDQKVTDTQIIHLPYDVKKKNNKYVAGYWKELWTVQYCSQKVQLPITFTIHKNKTTYFIDKSLILQ